MGYKGRYALIIKTMQEYTTVTLESKTYTPPTFSVFEKLGTGVIIRITKQGFMTVYEVTPYKEYRFKWMSKVWLWWLKVRVKLNWI